MKTKMNDNYILGELTVARGCLYIYIHTYVVCFSLYKMYAHKIRDFLNYTAIFVYYIQ